MRQHTGRHNRFAGIRSLAKDPSRRKRLDFDVLENRQLLATTGLPPTITVGRVLSEYAKGDIQNNQLTITYTVYNEQADTETGVLLTDTLASGVSLLNASVQPDQSGQNLSWSLPDIPGYGRDSVTETLSLPPTIPNAVDTGPAAYAMLDAGEVTDTAPAATLRAGTIDPSLLASTPDANTTDPFIQDAAAQLDYNATNIFNYLHAQIGYNSYLGSVRGARGTLWSLSGNALDTASLGVALMRASGIPAQYAQGTLTKASAQTLILSMFPPSYQTVGYVPSATQVADPANDPQLLSETESHYWLQYDPGTGMTNADPLMPGATIGHSFASVQSTFSEVPDSLREKTEVTVGAEIYNQLTNSTLVNGHLQTTTVLDQTFNDVDLVGRPISIGNFVSSSTQGFLYTIQTNTYEPYIEISDEAYPDPSQDEVIHGQSYQEVLTDFPLASEVLTGLFLNFIVSGPQGLPVTYSRTLVDRIGFANRQSDVAKAIQLPPIDAVAAPILNNDDIYTVSVLPSSQVAGPELILRNQATSLYGQLSLAAETGVSSPSSADALTRSYLIQYAEYELIQYLVDSDAETANLANAYLVVDYYAVPRITIFDTETDTSAQTVGMSLDLRTETLRVEAFPGQSAKAIVDFNFTRGFMDSAFETAVLATTAQSQSLSSYLVLQQAIAQGVPLVLISSDDLSVLDTLNLPADAKARIALAVAQGFDVLTPISAVSLNGAQEFGWYQLNPTTGEVVGVLANGGHQEAIEYAFLIFEDDESITVIIIRFIPPPEPPTLIEQIKFFGGKTLELLEGGAERLHFNDVTSLLIMTARAIVTALEQSGDPPVNNFISNLVIPRPDEPANESSTSVSSTSEISKGAIAAALSTPVLRDEGTISASWTAISTDSFLVSTLNSPQGEIKDAAGNIIGSGIIGFASPAVNTVVISGAVNYDLVGAGSMTFVGPAESNLGVAGDWNNYTASARGNVLIGLTSSGLTLNGQPLPYGAYTIATAAATFSGSGATASANFSGSVSVSTSAGTVELGSGSGSIAVTGMLLNPTEATTLTGYTGTIEVTANGSGSDEIVLHGSTSQDLQVGVDSATLATDQNTPITFATNIQTSLADTYTLIAQAPSGWHLNFESDGHLTATPATGLQNGTYPIQIIAQSTTDPDLIAQTVVEVIIKSTSAGSTFSIVPDPILTVPYNGAELPTAFQATIHNTGPAAVPYTLTFSNLPTGFTLLDSGTSVTVPPGQTGILGIYLVPNGGPVPAPGTQVSFTVTATSTSKPSTIQTQTVTFTIPNIDAITLNAAPVTVNTIPGGTFSDLVTIANAGNVPENVDLSSVASPGLSISGLADVSLQPGQSVTETIGITTDSSVPLESFLQTTLTASFGPAGAGLTTTLQIPVNVVVPGADAIANAAVAAGQLGYTSIAARLDDLSTALTNLVENPTSAVYLSQAVASIGALTVLFSADAYLSALIPGLTNDAETLATATSLQDIEKALLTLADDLGAVGTTLADEIAHGLTIILSPNQQMALPQIPVSYLLDIQNTGDLTTTYDLSVSGLPANVSASFNITSVTLQPGQALFGGPNGAVLTLTGTGGELLPFSFAVTATAEGSPEINRSAIGSLTVRTAFVQVASVTPSPSFTNPGGLVDVTARILNVTANPVTAQAYYTVTDANGNIAFSSTPVSVPFNSIVTFPTVDLGSFDTTGFAEGSYTISAMVIDPSGNPLTSVPGQCAVMIGTPVTASLTTSPTAVDGNFRLVQKLTNTLKVDTQNTFSSPLTLEGATATDTAETDVALDGTIAYVCGIQDISVVDVSDPTNPTVLSTFGSGLLGQNSDNVCTVSSSLLLVATQNAVNTNFFNLLIYSLSNPLSPSLVSNTKINYHFVAGLFTEGTTAFVPIGGETYFAGTLLSDQFGDLVSIDFSNPGSPKLADVLFNDRGAPDGGDHNVNSGVAVNSQYTYIATTSAVGDEGEVGNGELLVVDNSNPSQMVVTKTLQIPDTVQLLAVQINGTHALAIGSTGGDIDVAAGGLSNVKLTGNLTLTPIDISDPGDPKIIGKTLVTQDQFLTKAQNLFSGGIGTASLGNDLYAVSDSALNGNDVLLTVDASNPNAMVVGTTQTPVPMSGLTVSGSQLYIASQSGVSIYDIGQVVGIPLTLSVDVPTGTNVTYTPSTFSIPPSEIDHANGFDTLIWVSSFGAGTSDLTITWTSSLSAFQPTEASVVTFGGTVDFVSQGTTGELTLPGTFVDVERYDFLTAFPASKTVQPGATASYTARIGQDLSTADTYTVSIAGLPSSWLNVPATVTDPPHTESEFTIQVTPSLIATPGTYNFTVTITDGSVTDSYQLALIVQGQPVGQPDPDSHGIVVSVNPTSSEAGQGTSTQYLVQLTNSGSADDTFNLSAVGLPSDVTAVFGETTIDVPPGASNYRDVTLTLTPQVGTVAGSYKFQVLASSTSLSSVSDMADASLTVDSGGVSIAISPQSAPPGSPFDVTVTNTGLDTDTFNLSLAGPAALVSALSQDHVTLAPGASQVVPVTTGPVNFAVPGPLELTAVATSVSSSAIEAQASASLTIPDTVGLTAEFSPASQVIASPGTALFLLLVNNTGNTEDSYTATVIGTNGPVTASMTGLDGSPTQSISLFRIPGLGEAAILLSVNLAGLGEGQVTVEVDSLGNPGTTAIATATVNSAVIAPGLSLTSSPGSTTTYGQSVGFTASASPPASGDPVPTGSVQFQLDGVNFGQPVMLVNGSATSAAIKTRGAGQHTVTAIYSGDEVYSEDSLSATQNVSKATLTVTSGNLDINHGDSIPNPSYNITGFVNSDTIAVVNGNPGFSIPPGANETAGVYSITPTLGSLAAGNYNFNFVSGKLTVHPKVMDIRVQWGSQSMSVMNLNRDLPFIDISAIDVIFSDDVTVTSADLALTGVNVSNYSLSGFSYIPGKDEAIWSLSSAVGADRLTLKLDGTSTSGVKSRNGNIALMTNVNQGFAVLPGDSNGDGIVSVLDAVAVLNLTAQGAAYSAFGDLDGNGVVDMTDYANVRSRIGKKLP